MLTEHCKQIPSPRPYWKKSQKYLALNSQTSIPVIPIRWWIWRNLATLEHFKDFSIYSKKVKTWRTPIGTDQSLVINQHIWHHCPESGLTCVHVECQVNIGWGGALLMNLRFQGSSQVWSKHLRFWRGFFFSPIEWPIGKHASHRLVQCTIYTFEPIIYTYQVITSNQYNILFYSTLIL